jgi:AbrB family looped-hinge helix DNA binding protein
MVKLADATITSQGQISIPKKVREKLHLHKGAKLVFLEDETGKVFIQEAQAPVEFTQEEWREFLSKTEAEPVTRVKNRKEALRHLDKLTGKQ